MTNSATGPLVAITTRQYVRYCLGRYSLPYWLVGGPDYSRAVEYPLISRLVGARAGDRLLDVGAGRMAEFADLMAQRGIDVTAIDERDDLGEVAKARPGLRLMRADARKLDFPDASFERVTAISTIEHIERGDDAAMRELARVLAPGGRMAVSVPYNPLKRAEWYVRDGVYGRRGDRVFFAHIYDDPALQERIIDPTGLRLVERVNLGEPGVRVSGWYYPARGLTRLLRRVLPVGWLMGMVAPLFLRPVKAEQMHFDDWAGASVVLVFEK